MAKNYQISNNIIFCVNDDGSITKFATINDAGEIYRIGEPVKRPKGKTVWGYWIAIVIFVVATIAIFVLYVNMEAQYERQYSKSMTLRQQLDDVSKRNKNLENRVSSLSQEIESAEEALSTLKSKVGNAYPLIISAIEIANTYKGGSIETDYGNTLYSGNTMYLKPKITYYGISSGTKVLKVKWFKPDGSMSTGTSSPYGFSQSDSHNIYTGPDNTITMSGWGNEDKGHWRSGTYRIEVWYENTCLKSKTFTIY